MITTDAVGVPTASFIVTPQHTTYHEYPLVPPLGSGEADDSSGFSLLPCFHGLLDRRAERKVKTQPMTRNKGRGGAEGSAAA